MTESGQAGSRLATKRRFSFASGVSFEARIDPPDGLVTFVDVLPDIYSISDELVSMSVKDQAARGQHVSCARGCTLCCRHLVAVSDHEAILLAHIINNMLEGDEKQSLLRRLGKIVSILERTGLLSEMIDSHANAFADRGRIINAQRRYWEMQIPCPFLVSDSCSIYPYRPFLCRQYLVSSPPVSCEGSFKADHLVRKVTVKYDLASAAASFDGCEAKSTMAIPLPAINIVNGLLSNFRRPKAPADVMIAAFLRHAETHFSG
ncbi:hypothetical protein NNJEOMEG_02930 [Fundidesulfovibrio magnetotacticus]|uniref:YkgJ family cysteine cluster protein n=1 Tax=Fundidesulfovibrio magnetotacticus TaxID=2730080 RepID=A0A6V8LZK7_9BACT|nr:YkgJ family cysteine cluster protein [Fundidesulfovibrio magnetotacticus]GFK95077.1 hypothetical protein NNJEOMEG_02930 [Fundidesulfovibrio magnetotacticus]